MGKSLRSLFYLAWLCILASWPSYLRAECPVTATGLCTPGVEETIVEETIVGKTEDAEKAKLAEKE